MSQKKLSRRRVKDQLSQWHELTKELGRGGQGVVYRTSDPELLIKMPLKNGNEITDAAEVEAFQQKFERIYLLPLTEAMHITKPLYLLDIKQAGYVMQMMEDMQPIGHLLPQMLSKQNAKNFTRPDWLDKNMGIEAAYSLAMYAESGGTKRRLELLTQATIELLRLHSVGVIFMDVSPENIFVSTHSSYNEVWLIDADNLQFEIANAKKGMITPKYGAPEVVTGIDGARVVSDAYSWALLAFKILLMTSAFEGQRFIDGQDDEDDWADDESSTTDLSLEAQAEQGKLPFIFDAIDKTNQKINGLDSPLVLSPSLLSFFQKMFGEGRRSPWKRPSLHFLPRLLAKAADNSIQCNCGMSFYYRPLTKEKTCPYCKQPQQQILVVASYFYPLEIENVPAWTWVAPFTDKDFRLPRRVSGSFDINTHNAPMIEINQVEQDRFLYISEENIRVDVMDNNGDFHQVTGQWLLEKEQLEKGVQLYLHAPYSVIIEIRVIG